MKWAPTERTGTSQRVSKEDLMKLSSGLRPQGCGKRIRGVVWQQPERQKAKGRQASLLDKGSGEGPVDHNGKEND